MESSRSDPKTTAEKGTAIEDYESYESTHLARECECDLEMKQKFDMPVVKRYLPMYQSPELIEELKRHDRMRLIRENEAKTRRSSSRSPDSTSARTKIKDQRTTVSPDATVSILIVSND